MDKVYKVVDDGIVRSGTAQEILSEILSKQSSIESDLTNMDLDQYADALVRGADYHLPKTVASEFSQIKFPTKYDQALEILSILPSSGTVIMRKV